jgi:hypothetical protein
MILNEVVIYRILATVAFYEVLKMGRKHGLSVKIQLDLFDKMVKPILLYGCEVWGFSNNDIIEKVLLKFSKLLLHLKSSTPDCFALLKLPVLDNSIPK